MTSKDAIEAKLLGSFPGRFVGAMPLASLRTLTTNCDLVDTLRAVPTPLSSWMGMNTNRPWGGVAAILGHKKRFYPPFESSNKQSISTRAHMVACANASFATQFRRFGFSILLCGTWAVSVYWDRSGAVVSRRFQYTANFAPLAEFLWGLNHGPPGDRGRRCVCGSRFPSGVSRRTVRELLALGPKRAEDRPSSTTHHFYVGPHPAQK
ncbi:hypothetical protein EDD22DRAFT_942034, partial [Suillus occidentalis]